MGRNAARRRALKPPRHSIAGQYVPAVPFPESRTVAQRTEARAARAAMRPVLCPRCGTLGVSEASKTAPGQYAPRCGTCGASAEGDVISSWVRGERARLPVEVLDALFVGV